jgi:hypothetical protein
LFLLRFKRFTSSILKSRTYTTENATDPRGFGRMLLHSLIVDPFQKIWRLYVLVAIGIVIDQLVGILIPDSAMGSGVVVLHYGLVQEVECPLYTLKQLDRDSLLPGLPTRCGSRCSGCDGLP